MDDKEQFVAVTGRLIKALKLKTEGALAKRLDLGASAFGNRKSRGVLPREEIDALIEAEGLNPAWVYLGTGPQWRGGDHEARVRAEFRELVEQLQAMQLHERSRALIEELLMNVLRGNSDGVEGWLSKLSDMNPTERQLLNSYRHGSPEIRVALEVVAKSGVVPSKGSAMAFHGSVGQAVGGDVHTQHQTWAVHEQRKSLTEEQRED